MVRATIPAAYWLKPSPFSKRQVFNSLLLAVLSTWYTFYTSLPLPLPLSLALGRPRELAVFTQLTKNLAHDYF